MTGRKLPARDLRVLTAVAKQAAGLVKQREFAEEASDAEAIAHADELRRSLLSAVDHDLRTPLAAADRGVEPAQWRRRLLAADPPNFSPPSRSRSITDRAGGGPARLVAAGRRRRSAELRRVYLEEVVQRALLGVSRGTTGFRADWTASRSRSTTRSRWPTPACWSGFSRTWSTTHCAMRPTASCGSMRAMSATGS